MRDSITPSLARMLDVSGPTHLFFLPAVAALSQRRAPAIRLVPAVRVVSRVAKYFERMSN